jgi:hypothetical protein
MAAAAADASDRPPGAPFMRRTAVTRCLIGLAYALTALAVTGVWIHFARTEYQVDEQVVLTPSGVVYSTRFCSIVRLAQGKALSPFVRRRLLADLARGLAAVVPDSLWEPLRRRVRGLPGGPPWLRLLLRRQGWRAEDIPLLGCAYLLIAGSVLGFMLTCRWLVNVLYEAPPWLADLAALVLGAALLGGNGDWHYCGYPYDFPQAFVFTLTLTAMLARRWWFLLGFAAAAYSKETSGLLMVAYVLLAWDRRCLRFWACLALQAVVFIGIRGWLEIRYPAPQPPGGFWALGRNLKYLSFPVFYSWSMPFFVVGLARLVSLRGYFPSALKRLCVLAVPLVGMALFKGWLEELRQYLELLPIAGLLLLHWCLHEAGYGHLLKARGGTAAPRPQQKQTALAA